MTLFSDIVLLDYASPLAERAATRKHCGPYHWHPATPGTGRGFYQGKQLACDRHGSSFNLRLENANDILGPHSRTARTTGYYADDFGDDTLQPIVARLPHGRGFLAGWTMGAGMAGALDACRYDDAESAAYAAHSMAEFDAETSRAAQEATDAIDA